MKKEIIICDICNKELPIIKKKDFFGIEREYYKIGKIKIDDFTIDLARILGVHVCDKCAGEITIDILKQKINLLSKGV